MNVSATNILAIAVGVAVIVTMAAVLYDDAPSEGDTDVIFMMGQSNATYLIKYVNAGAATPVPEPGTAYYYGTEAKPAGFPESYSNCGIYPMSTAEGSRIGDKWPAIAAEYVEATGHKVLMAQIASGGQSIVKFSPTDGHLWTESTARVAEVLRAMDEAGMKPGRISVVWIQGESDLTMSAEEYKQRFLEMGKRIANGGLGCEVTLPIWISLIRGDGGSVEAQQEIVIEKPGIFRMATEIARTFTVQNGLCGDDNLHYSQAGNNVVGAAIGEAVGEGITHDEKADNAIWLFISLGIIGFIVIATVQIFKNRF